MFTKRRILFVVPAFFIFLIVVLFGFSHLFQEQVAVEQSKNETSVVTTVVEVAEEEVVLHIETPEEVRGIYWTAATATNSRADDLLAYMLETGINSVVIDVKMDNGELVKESEFVQILQKLHDAKIYRIARIAVMRDGMFALEHPEVALRTYGGGFWYDNIGSVWVDPAAQEVADYAIELGSRFYAIGFDEIQYDYVRFASDGSISSIVYPVYDYTKTKIEVMQEFFNRVGSAMQAQNIPVSFDVFGMTFESMHDYNIGQRLVDVFNYADFVSPMVYPSHYPDGFKGMGNPALYPYEIVKMALDSGTDMVLGVYSGSEDELRKHWRPWLQDFDIGAVYTSDLIEAQIQASRDAGASGWILWNARNVYESANYLEK